MSKKSKNKQKKEKQKEKKVIEAPKNHSSACNCKLCQEAKESQKNSSNTNKGNDTTKSTTTTYYNSEPCHEGNVEVFKKDGVTVYAGGDFRDAEPNEVDVVLDLASNIKKNKWDIPSTWSSAKFVTGPKHVLDLHITDYSIPKLQGEGVKKEFWSALWKDLKKIAPVSVLAMCQGGHGRTGVVVTCLMMAAKLDIGDENAILWLRDKYCEKVVESQSQIVYLGDMYDIPYTKESKPPYNPYQGGGSSKSNLPNGYQGSGTGYGANKPKCHKGCGSEGGDVVWSADIKKNECDECWHKRSEKNIEECHCTNAYLCTSCRENGVVCKSSLCDEDTNYTCDDCTDAAADAAADAAEQEEGDGIGIHSLTDEEYETLESITT